MSWSDPLPGVRPLPRTARLFQDETTASYIGRLEKANALRAGHLKRMLRRTRRPWIEALATWTEYDPTVLCLAMPQLARQDAGKVFDPRSAGRPNRKIQGLACHRCALTRCAVGHIQIYTTHERVLCPRHGLWLGDGVETTEDQVPVGACKALNGAWHQHLNLITRFGHSRVRKAFYISSYINRRWYEQLQHFDEFAILHEELTSNRRQEPAQQHPAVAAALYPSTVRLTAMIASPFWLQMAHSGRPDRFLDRVSGQVTNGWRRTEEPTRCATGWSTTGFQDPLEPIRSAARRTLADATMEGFRRCTRMRIVDRLILTAEQGGGTRLRYATGLANGFGRWRPDMSNSFDARDSLTVGDDSYEIFRLDAVEGSARLPYSLKVLLENLLRNEDGTLVTADQVRAVAARDPKAEHGAEIQYTPARVLLQDFTGVPCVVDLVAMRDAMASFGGDPQKINPLIPSELVIDHSVIADSFGA